MPLGRRQRRGVQVIVALPAAVTARTQCVIRLLLTPRAKRTKMLSRQPGPRNATLPRTVPKRYVDRCYLLPRMNRTTTTVRSRICRSSQSDQSDTYSASSATRVW